MKINSFRFSRINTVIENSLVDLLFREIHSTVSDLGRYGGLISPSVYDTAQRLRLLPQTDSLEFTLDWLIDQQKADGGWGDPILPAYRDIPSLAAILALQSHSQFPRAAKTLQAGLDFLQNHAYHWHQQDLDSLPVAAELIIPKLLEECQAAGLSLSLAPYTNLIAIRDRKQQKLHQMLHKCPPQAGNPVLHSWEVWGTKADSILIDGLGSVSCSPSATSAWLRAAANQPALDEVRAKVQNYLNQSAASTKSGIPGVISTVWPIDYFETCWSLEALLLTRLIKHPVLEQVALRQSREIARVMDDTGLGMTAFFEPDADDTAAAISILHTTGLPIDISILKRFEKDGVFSCYIGERSYSISATARGIRVLAMTGETISENVITLLNSHSTDGRWCGDKWHSSWLYTTLHCLLALLYSGYHGLDKTIATYLSHQHADGGWGEGNRSTAEETAYAVIALLNLEYFGLLSNTLETAMQRGFRWLLKHYNPCVWSKEALYISKELYNPYRITHTYILSAMLSVALRNQ